MKMIDEHIVQCKKNVEFCREKYWKNIYEKSETRYHVEKDGRCVSDYGNKKDAEKHAKEIGGEVSTEIIKKDKR